jgi:hypothetical protein
MPSYFLTSSANDASANDALTGCSASLPCPSKGSSMICKPRFRVLAIKQKELGIIYKVDGNIEENIRMHNYSRKLIMTKKLFPITFGFALLLNYKIL